MASKVAAEKLDSIAELFEYESDNYENLVQTCMTTLSSKMYAPPPRKRGENEGSVRYLPTEHGCRRIV